MNSKVLHTNLRIVLHEKQRFKSVGALAQRASGRRDMSCLLVAYCAGLSVGALAQRPGQAGGVRCVARSLPIAQG